jgi:hypothetical protein
MEALLRTPTDVAGVSRSRLGGSIVSMWRWSKRKCDLGGNEVVEEDFRGRVLGMYLFLCGSKGVAYERDELNYGMNGL